MKGKTKKELVEEIAALKAEMAERHVGVERMSEKMRLMQDVCDKARDYFGGIRVGKSDTKTNGMLGALASLDAWKPDIEEHNAQTPVKEHFFYLDNEGLSVCSSCRCQEDECVCVQS